MGGPKHDNETRNAEKRLEALLTEGLESRESKLTRKDFKNIREQALSRLRARKSKR